MAEYEKPIPTIDMDTKAFWEACKTHVLHIPKCDDCGEFFYPPQKMCPHCLSDKITLEKVSGKGEVYSMSIVHQNRSPGFRDEVPYVIAYITLDDAEVQMFSNIVDVDNPYDVKIGSPVEVFFRDVSAEISLPVFRLSR